MSTSETEASGTMCVANIGKAGRRRRARVGGVIVVLTVGLLGWLIAAHEPWYVRLAVFVPAAAAGITLLQVTRNTCVAVAAKGVRENEDFTFTPVDQILADASRKVAATIYRDSVLIGAAAAVLSALTALAS